MQDERVRTTGSLRQFAAKLRRDCRGSTYAMLAMALIPVLGMIGGGLDIGRAYLVKSRLQTAVDAASLSGIRAQQSDAAQGEGSYTWTTVDQYLAANFPVGYVGYTPSERNIVVTREGTTITLDLEAKGTVPTTLLRIFGIPSLSVSAQARAEAGESETKAVEAMMVLDVTGSMDGAGMTALKSSMTQFLDIVYGNSQTRKNFAIGVLPYAVFANVGRLLPASMVESVNGYTTRSATDAYGWKGCVFADPTRHTLSTDTNVIDANTFDMGKTLPGENGMPRVKPAIYPPLWVRSFHRQDNRYQFPSDATQRRAIANYAPMRAALIRQYGDNICRRTNNNNEATCSSGDASNRWVDPTRITGYSSWQVPQLYNATLRPSNANGHVSRSPSYVCPTEALPISYARTKAELTAYKDNLQPLFNIGTWHVPAMTWGYRLLARDDTFTRARPANIGLRRVMIFMTDGNFDSNDEGSTAGDTNQSHIPAQRGNGHAAFQRDTAYTAYQSYADKRVVNQDWPSGNTGRTEARIAHRDAMALRFLKTCQAMKSEGIEIYTITFAISNNAEGEAAREMFKTCSTNANTHFFETQDPSDLNIAFTTIAADLIDLHLSR